MTAFSPLGHASPEFLDNPVLKEVAQQVGKTVAQVSKDLPCTALPCPCILVSCLILAAADMHLLHFQSKVCTSGVP